MLLAGGDWHVFTSLANLEVKLVSLCHSAPPGGLAMVRTLADATMSKYFVLESKYFYYTACTEQTSACRFVLDGWYWSIVESSKLEDWQEGMKRERGMEGKRKSMPPRHSTTCRRLWASFCRSRNIEALYKHVRSRVVSPQVGTR